MLKVKRILLLLMVALAGCDNFNDENYSYVDYGVLSRAGSYFLITTDPGIKLLAESLPVDLEFEDNLRVAVEYTFIKQAGEDQDFDYWVNVEKISEIQTKEIVVINDENRDTLGCAPVDFKEVYIIQDFLTVYFTFYASNKDHYFNLTYDSNEQTDDNFVTLRFRHQDNDDQEAQKYTGFVSFRLNSLRQPDRSEINIHFRGKQYSEVEYRIDDLVYKY